MWYIQNKICGFLLQSTYNSSYSSQNYVSNPSLIHPITPHIGQSQVTSSWFQKQQKFKFKLTMFHDQSLSKCLVHPNHVLILPLTLPPLYYGFCPQNHWKMTDYEMIIFCNVLNIYLFHYNLYSFDLFSNRWFYTHLWLYSFDLLHQLNLWFYFKGLFWIPLFMLLE